jgi:long-chain fatty acid transport protein
MSKKMAVILFVVIMLCGALSAFGSGYKNFDLSARAATLGGAFVARVDDATAVFYNPAGIVFQEGVRLKTQILYGRLTTTGKYGDAATKMKSNPGQIQGYYYLTWQIIDKLSFGIGSFSPYVTNTSWPRNWEGGALNVTSILNSTYIRPVLAFKISDQFSIGAGVDFVFTKVEWTHNLLFSLRIPGANLDSDVPTTFNVNGNGITYVVSALYKPSDKLRIGGKYQHKVDIDMDGLMAITPPASRNLQVPTPTDRTIHLPDLIVEFYKEQEVTSSTTMPSEVTLGFYYAPVDKLTLQFDIHWTKWSDVKSWEFTAVNSTEDLNPEFTEEYGDFYGLTPDYGQQGVGLIWKDAWSFNFGIEYFLSKVIALRAGFAHSQSQVDDANINPIHPNLGYNIITSGLGYEGPVYSQYDGSEIGWLSFDFFIQYRISSRRTVVWNDSSISYGGQRFVVGIGFGLNF